MSRYNPGTLTAALARLANSPNLGINAFIYASLRDPVLYGKVVTDGAGVAAFTAEPGAAIPVAGEDMVLRVVRGGDSVTELTNIKIAFDVNSGSTPETLDANFNVSSWAEWNEIGEQVLTISNAVDIGGTGDSVIKEIDSVTATNMPFNAEFEVWGMPPSDKYFAVTCTKDKSGPATLPATVPVGCGDNPQEYVLPGRPEVQNLRIVQNDFDFGRGLSSLAGHRATIKMDVLKHRNILSARYVWSGYIPSGSPEFPAGANDEVDSVSEGPYEKFFAFLAR